MNLVSPLDASHQQLGSAILIKPLDQKANSYLGTKAFNYVNGGTLLEGSISS